MYCDEFGIDRETNDINRMMTLSELPFINNVVWLVKDIIKITA